ncbi:MAG: Asp-tRNA(Asn)/Glu-tRNA(Gln) amidotransferase subunit GatB [Candidatus Berkelbacteria bacterium]|nr:Asp-tRNA(Asn)/Glu-tRNA(Gln) amidotransferase subunit GatB [Candidatus Berkelbacteria bacterium]
MNEFTTMDSTQLTTRIGLEIHVQLNTKSKMFCGCSNDAEDMKPNTILCPICFGMPGTLPVPNREAVEKTVRIGLALNSKIAKFSKFDRKHYFYPDLPKGYQISQYDMPFCIGGESTVAGETIRFNRVHLEEDAGKLLHLKGVNYSIVDLNRAGTPLAEMVTEPDITSPEMAREFLKELRDLLRSIGVSDADMEKGQMRCDANISITRNSKTSDQRLVTSNPAAMSVIVEIKNLNSFKFVEKALSYEEKRLTEDFENWPIKVTKVTRGFDSNSGKTYVLREKEEAKDYRYFPEPDIPPIYLHEEFNIEEIKKSLPVLPAQIKEKLIEFGVNPDDTLVLLKDQKLLKSILELIEKKPDRVAKISKVILNLVSARKLNIRQLIDLDETIETNQVPSNIVRQIVDDISSEDQMPSNIYLGKFKNTGEGLSDILAMILKDNQDAVDKYKSGKTQVLGFLVGQVMKSTQGKFDPNQIRKEIIEKINLA